MQKSYEALKAENANWARICREQARRIEELEAHLAERNAPRKEKKMDNNTPYNERFKVARKAAGLTQKGIAEKYKIPSRTIEAWEMGERTPPEYVQRLMLEAIERLISEKE